MCFFQPKSVSTWHFRLTVGIFWMIAIGITVFVIYILPSKMRPEAMESLHEVLHTPMLLHIPISKLNQSMQEVLNTPISKPNTSKPMQSMHEVLNTSISKPIPIPAATLFSHRSKPLEAMGELYHDPESFCKLPIDHYKNNSNIKYYNRFPDGLTIEQVIAKRTEPTQNIPMCPNSDNENYNQHKDVLSKLPNNLIQYTNRCQINAIGRGKRQFGGLLSGNPLFPYLSTQIGFLHVYKAGGTTVRDTMHNILPGLGRTIWHSYTRHLREFMSHLFMFSHVRDPVTRLISSYFELHRRNESDVVNNDMIGMDSFRFMLAMMENRMDCSLANKNRLHKMRDFTISDIYFNMHIMPQMYFLTEGVNPWRAWPLNYVGNMTEIKQSMFEIFYHFYWNTTDYLKHKKVTKALTYEQARDVFHHNYHHGRDRHHRFYLNGGEREGVTVGNEALLYQIELDDLKDDDIRQICDVYWMDYICIPFPIPKACNLTELLLRHYGADVVYKDCWEYKTREWDPEFVREYRNGTRRTRRNQQRRPMHREQARAYGKRVQEQKMRHRNHRMRSQRHTRH